MTQREFIDFLNKVEVLKHNTRHCWGADGRRESVAEHCWRLSLMPMLVKDEFPYVDIDKVIKMCIIHDLGEAVTGDIPAFEKTDDDEINSVATTSDGGYIVGGYFESSIDLENGVILTNKRYEDGMIIKYNANGEVEWGKAIGGAGIDEINSVAETTDGSYIIVGDFYSKSIDLE